MALGRQFNMVTPFTSLIVLDNLEQYVVYEIAPPKSLSAMREEYMRRIDTLEVQKRKEKGDKIEQVLKMWNERVKWWETEFKVPADFRYKEPPQTKDAARPRLGLPNPSGQGAPPPPVRGDAATTRPPTAAGEPNRPEPRREERVLPGEAGPAPAGGGLGGSFGGGMRGQYATNAGDATLSFQQKQSAQQPGILIKPWDPQTPYLKELRAAKGKDLFVVYMANRAKYGNSPAFFLDCADFFFEQKDDVLGLQVLSNIAELQLEDAAVLRILGYRLRQAGFLDLAIQTFEQVLKIRPEEPQSYRDLALTLAERARKQPARAHADYARAIDLLTHVVMGRWDERFPEIEVIALEELNDMLPEAKASGDVKVDLDPRLLKLLEVDVRIVMTWHADDTDIDLWVTEPSGEKAMYNHNRTTIGGLVSRDFTGGYGPEEYMVRKAMHGMYKIEANYYGSRAAKLLGPVTVQVDVFTALRPPGPTAQDAHLPADRGQGDVYDRGDRVLKLIRMTPGSNCRQQGGTRGRGEASGH